MFYYGSKISKVTKEKTEKCKELEWEVPTVLTQPLLIFCSILFLCTYLMHLAWCQSPCIRDFVLPLTWHCCQSLRGTISPACSSLLNHHCGWICMSFPILWYEWCFFTISNALGQSDLRLIWRAQMGRQRFFCFIKANWTGSKLDHKNGSLFSSFPLTVLWSDSFVCTGGTYDQRRFLNAG
jgi:hypothetical protein